MRPSGARAEHSEQAKVRGYQWESDKAKIGAALPVDDLRALHHRDGPWGSRGREGLGPIPEAACQLPPAASSREPSPVDGSLQVTMCAGNLANEWRSASNDQS